MNMAETSFAGEGRMRASVLLIMKVVAVLMPKHGKGIRNKFEKNLKYHLFIQNLTNQICLDVNCLLCHFLPQ